MKAIINKKIINLFLIALLSAIYFVISMSTSTYDTYATYADEQWQEINSIKQERCTYRVWHEAYERLGISLPTTWGNANSWAYNARNSGYIVDNTPKPNSIVCWSGSEYGHIAYVTGVDDNNIYIREAGINPSNNYSGYWWRDTYFEKSNQNRFNGYTLQGYIHLDTQSPSGNNLKIKDIENDQFTVSIHATDDLSGVASVNFDVWTINNGKDDLVRYEGHLTDEKDIYQVSIPFSDHNNASNDKYIIYAYLTDNSNNKSQMLFQQYVQKSKPSENTSNNNISSDDIVSISAGYNQSSATKADGSVWMWGGLKNYSGLAAGYIVDRAPTMIFSSKALSSKCSQNFDYSFDDGTTSKNKAILKEDNSLWMFGPNKYGALGDGTTNSHSAPFKVLDNVVEYEIGGSRSAAVTSDGKLYMWGYNKHGQIGNGTTGTSVYSPVEVLSDVVSVSINSVDETDTAGGHSAAVTADGSLYMWGCNKYGQLGDGTTTDSCIPKKITDNVQQVSLGNSFTVVLKNDGTVWTCGCNNSGQLAKGSIIRYNYDEVKESHSGAYYIVDKFPTNVPESDKILTKVVDLEDENIQSIEAGSNHAAAISSNGTLYVWGGNSNGQIGNGSTSSVANPTIILRDVSMVSLGDSHSIAVKSDNTLWSWGYNYYGQLGNLNDTTQNSPVKISLGSRKADFKAGDTSKQIDVNWDDNYLNQSSGSYNQNLAIDGIVLSEAAYSSSNVLSQFGFKVISNTLNNNAIDKPGYIIAYKVMYDFGEPRVEIIMAIRGTKSIVSADALTDIKSVTDGFEAATQYCYTALKNAKSQISYEIGNLGIFTSKKILNTL